MRSGKFKLKSNFKPAGDQPRAINELVEGLEKGMRYQTLLGVTGSGKTFTMANVIEKIQKPTLVIAHNKTLAAQLAQEYREFFPENAVHYFVSYYDYYQPEAYMPITDTYIEKEAMINEEIERLRHASTQALLTRRDVIIVASVSCIYGLGSPEEYEKVNIRLEVGKKISRSELLRAIVGIHFERTNADLSPGQFRALGNAVEIMPVGEREIWRLEFGAEGIEQIRKIDPISRADLGAMETAFLFPAKHFITDKEQVAVAIKTIKSELAEQLKKFEKEGKLLEAERLERRTNYDLALIREIGYCNGIENYSRHFSGKLPGEAPDTLLEYFKQGRGQTPTTPRYQSPPRRTRYGARRGQMRKEELNFLTIIDESHVTVPQIGGMYAGDASRKKTLVEHGFRLPSACDNRPLKFAEFEERVGQVIFTSATPADFEREHSAQVAKQVIRPTGLIDPEVFVRPILAKGNYAAKSSVADDRPTLSGKNQKGYRGQIADFITEAEKDIKAGGRVIATTLTKKMAEDLSEFLKDPKSLGGDRARKGIKAEYLHSDIKTIERIEILTKFRRGEFDVLVGVNLLREGLDLPEVSLIGILDADKEGFLRSETSLIQTIGRAARNVLGRVILYADRMTGSMEYAISETNRRRALQIAYNKKHGITPKTIIKNIRDITETLRSEHGKAVDTLLKIDRKMYEKDPAKLIKEKERQMNAAVKVLDFETAAVLRDEIEVLKGMSLSRVKKI